MFVVISVRLVLFDLDWHISYFFVGLDNLCIKPFLNKYN